MTDSFKEKKSVMEQIKLIKGGGGIFDVKCNGKLIYSKLDVKGQRFPADGELSRLIVQGVR